LGGNTIESRLDAPFPFRTTAYVAAPIQRMTAEIAMRIGMAGRHGVQFAANHRHRAVVGKDTRLSGYMIEQALTAGSCRFGMDVLLLGPCRRRRSAS